MVNADGTVLDTDLSIRFKHGIQTIFLFVNAQSTLVDVAEELLEVLRERYSEGLTTAMTPPKKTELPDEAAQIEFAVPRSAADPTWSPVDMSDSEGRVAHIFKDQPVVAFAIRPADAAEDDELEFEVEFPSYDDEYGDEDEKA